MSFRTFVMVFVAMYIGVTKVLPKDDVCRESEMFTGTICDPCPLCAKGTVLDTRIERKKNEYGSYIECYPCLRKCDEGYYLGAVQGSDTPKCFKCALDCNKLNRYDYRDCGPFERGQCGGCNRGYRSVNKLPESFCKPEGMPITKQSPILTPSIKPPVSPITSEGYSTLNTTLNDRTVQRNHRPSDNYNIFTTLQILVAFACVLLGSMTIGFVCIIRAKFKLMHSSRIGGHVFPSSSSGLPSAKSWSDIETDNAADDEEEPLTDVIVNPCFEGTRVHSASYPDCRFETWDKDQFLRDCFVYVAKNISGCRVTSFFNALGLMPSVYEPEEGLFDKKKQTYSDYICNVLKRWLEMNDKPNLQDLCKALEISGFSDLAIKLAHDYRNRSRSMHCEYSDAGSR